MIGGKACAKARPDGFQVQFNALINHVVYLCINGLGGEFSIYFILCHLQFPFVIPNLFITI